MSGPDSILDPVARRIIHTGSYTSACGLATNQLSSSQLGSTRLATDDVADGSHMLMCQLIVRWHGTPNVHADAMITSWWHHHPSGSVMCVGSSGIRVGLGHRGKEDAWHAWGAPTRVDRRLAGTCGSVQPCPTYNFDVVFTSVFVSSSSTQWYNQNTILTTFIFEQKSNTTLNCKLLYQLLGISTLLHRPMMFW